MNKTVYLIRNDLYRPQAAVRHVVAPTVTATRQMARPAPVVSSRVQHKANLIAELTSDVKSETKAPRRRERLTHLTAAEKLNRRKMKNREAAQNARDRKKEQSKRLEEVVEQLVVENKQLRAENQRLMARLRRFEQNNGDVLLDIPQTQRSRTVSESNWSGESMTPTESGYASSSGATSPLSYHAPSSIAHSPVQEAFNSPVDFGARVPQLRSRTVRSAVESAVLRSNSESLPWIRAVRRVDAVSRRVSERRPLSISQCRRLWRRRRQLAKSFSPTFRPTGEPTNPMLPLLLLATQFSASPSNSTTSTSIPSSMPPTISSWTAASSTGSATNSTSGRVLHQMPSVVSKSRPQWRRLRTKIRPLHSKPPIR